MMEQGEGDGKSEKTAHDLFLDDLNGIFDDDDDDDDNNDDDDESPVDGLTFEGDAIEVFGLSHDDSSPSTSRSTLSAKLAAFANEVALSSEQEAAEGKKSDEKKPKPQSNPNARSKGKKRRQRTLTIEGGGKKSGPPPKWYSEAADKQHRQAMVLEIARLLQLRKKEQPSAEWLHQLPHKARNLEEKLYRTAPSLESYLDRTTLKNRLRRLAQVIAKQFKDGKRHSGYAKKRSSTSSQSSITSFGGVMSGRDSITSVNSLDSLRSLQESFDQNAAIESSSSEQRRDSSSSFTAPKRSSSLGIISESPKTSLEQSNSLPRQGSETTTPAGAEGISELQRQQAVNQSLQQQILENIRQQELIAKTLLSRGQSGQGLSSPVPGMATNTASANLNSSTNASASLGHGLQQSTVQNSVDTLQDQTLAAQQTSGMQRNMLNLNMLLQQSQTQGGFDANTLSQITALNNTIKLQNNMLQNPQGQITAQATSMNTSSLGIHNPNHLQQSHQNQSQRGLTTNRQLQLLQNVGQGMMLGGTYATATSSLQTNQLRALQSQTAGQARPINPTMPPPPIIQRPNLEGTNTSTQIVGNGPATRSSRDTEQTGSFNR